MPKRTSPADDAHDSSMSRGDYVQFRDRWMKHVLGKDWLPERHRLIAVRIALYANFDEQYARPSVATIAIDTACAVRTVVRAIANLEKEKLMRIERRKRGVNRYFLII